MVKKSIFKDNKGVTGSDLSIAIIVIIMFVSIISTLFYNVYIITQKTNRNVGATDIITNIFEKMQDISYDEVIINEQDNTKSRMIQVLENELSINRIGNLNIENQIYIGKKGGYTVKVEIQKYCEQEANQDKNLEDIIKIVKLTVEYPVGKNTEKIEMSTLKIKE